MPNAKDYKKEYKDLYLPKTKPMIIDIPEMYFVSVEGKGNPNVKGGEYQKALGVLYGIQYTIKMSKMGNPPNGYFDYVVPPLEGLWWLENNEEFSPQNKSEYCWISIIRLPEFVDKKVFNWACDEVAKKKNIDTKKAKFIKIKEGLCIQCMHVGSYNDEPKTLKMMDKFIADNNLMKDLSETRRHHEIYLSDPKKTDKSKIKTVLRIPVKKESAARNI
ncbi:MAG: GyrI-like domain-containing protein [Treponema sp.]|jgi:hypothetical protein|nr:GyrI-like domain-containing protein [Treponema sp.]